MSRTLSCCAISLALAVGAGAVAAEEEKPRILILPETSETALPGDTTGTRLGITIRRGSGFPEPPPPTEPVEEAEALEPPPAYSPRRARRRSSYRVFFWDRGCAFTWHHRSGWRCRIIDAPVRARAPDQRGFAISPLIRPRHF